MYITARRTASLCRRQLQRRLFSSQTYTRPLPAGALEVYDHALLFLAQDRDVKLARISSLQEELPSLTGEAAEGSKKEIARLEVEAWINDPEVRWMHNMGLWDMSKPVYRHLREQQWRKEGVLDLLMERLWQMHIIPDVLPWVDPTLDMRLQFPTERTEEVVKIKGKDDVVCQEGDIEPGTFVLPSQTSKEPQLYVTAFHPEERFYTLVMVDPDVPSPETQSYSTLLHWLVPNIPLSCLSPSSPIALPPALLPYIPPHPQQGSGYHRYTTFLLPQRALLTELKTPLRRNFNLRDFVRQYSLSGSPVPGAPKPILPGHGKKRNGVGEVTSLHTGAEVGGGGVHMFREVWDESVTALHERVFGVGERRFGKLKQGDPYVDEEGRRPRRYY
ncbi:PEBP-like protein [Dacryopinax primogenitus]|uniref:PEBP-like protein n=1 Tax=Dacryopinax primogenitus (strain DJM 731) TaxID=1858805 RepID=M5G5I8_DACPD|nr:PEBP-like protein [Dacryopinax primogenitus]EJT99022.1 PEBP-like protein [Dacryopinax primogenitus]